MQIQELWRYPVKSMRGERLTEARLQKSGVQGDRNIVVVSQSGDRIITARTHPGLLGLQASVSPQGLTMIEGHPWHSAEALALTREAAREAVRLVDAGERTERFDVLPLLVATDGALRELGLDLRRVRPNVVIGGVAGLAERSWPGSALRSGQVVIHAAQLRMRCVMTTFDPDTLQQDLGVLRKIVREANGKLALDCAVANPGVLHEGDPITLSSRPH
ncbi:MAG: MOSC N-terminal beta barrel domain-containing protein [Candidatus Sulfotelmatobacter sp.]